MEPNEQKFVKLRVIRVGTIPKSSALPALETAAPLLFMTFPRKQFHGNPCSLSVLLSVSLTTSGL